MRTLARRLLALEAATPTGNATGAPAAGVQHEAAPVFHKLGISLIRFAGADGFAALLRRALALARAQFPSLNRITIKPDCSMDGLEALAGDDADGGAEAAAALTAHLLDLLVTFIGEPLTLRLVREAWPDQSLDE